MTYSAQLDRQIPSSWEVMSLSHLVGINGKNINPANYPNKEFCYYDIPTYDTDKSYSCTMGNDIGSSKLSVSNMHILVSKLNPKFKRVIYSANKENMIASTEFVQLTATS